MATIQIGSVGEFLLRIAEIKKQWFKESDEWGPWFRGHQRAHWPLCPKLYREYGGYTKVKKMDIEDEIREEFIVRAPALSETKVADGDKWEWYFLMQHFGAPTRLLDWSDGSLIGLFFAVKDNLGFYDSAVWMLDPFALNDEVIGKEEVIPPTARGITEPDKMLVDPWLPERFTKMKGLPTKPVAIYPTHIARRISTQRSCFTVHGTNQHGLDELAKKKSAYLLKIVIPAFRVQSIRKELEECGIDEATIFPDLEGLSRTICARWKDNEQSSAHHGVYTRLRPSKVHKGGIGVFAIRKIKKEMPLFNGDNAEMLWIKEEIIESAPAAIRKLYDDFSVAKDGWHGCPMNFNRLTPSWYLNRPNQGERPNVRCDPDTYDFFALNDIDPGEELTVDYSSYDNRRELARVKPKARQK
jgi:hypothetical protein